MARQCASTSPVCFNTIPIYSATCKGGIVQQTFIPHAGLRTGYKCLDVMFINENSMISWPAVISYKGEDELTFISDEHEWKLDPDLHFHPYS